MIIISNYTLWKIGKLSYELNSCYENIFDKFSTYFSYYFGNSYLFTRKNIKYMRKFYLQFPIYYPTLENVSWSQFLLILNIDNREEAFFYYLLVIFFNCDYEETYNLIKNNYFNRI